MSLKWCVLYLSCIIGVALSYIAMFLILGIAYTGCPKKMYHICFAYSFYSFQHSQLRPTSKDSQFHGDLLTPPMVSVASSWLPLWHVLEVSVFLGHTALLGVWPPRPYI